MNGAESLVRTLLASGVDTCFANPGTSEMHFVAALDKVEGMRCVLGMAETVVTGCADGYGRMTGKPAATLMHCGPGLANGISNIHNARRAETPMVNIVGDHATYHRPFDAPLTADTEGLARAVSNWVRTCSSSTRVGADAAAAVQAAKSPPGQIATLILPADTAWNEGGEVGDAGSVGSGLDRAWVARGPARRTGKRREAAGADADPAHGARPRPTRGRSHSVRRGQCAQGACGHQACDHRRCETADRVLRLSG
jgi:thiamine pyrophosphate-dependent acetolactate synthase large subunit-like protein